MCDALCSITQLESYSTHTQTHWYTYIFFFLCTYTKLNFTAMFFAFVLLCFVSRFVEGTSPLCTIVRAKRHVHIEGGEEEEQQHIET